MDTASSNRSPVAAFNPVATSSTGGHVAASSTRGHVSTSAAEGRVAASSTGGYIATESRVHLANVTDLGGLSRQSRQRRCPLL
jgi:hypothetical protein